MTGIPVAVGELVGTDFLNEVARAHWRQTTLVDVVNTVTESDLIGTQGSGLTISAGALSSARKLRIFADCDLIGAASTTPSERWKLYLGGTVIIDSGALAIRAWSATPQRLPLKLEIEIAMLGATNSENAHVRIQTGDSSFTAGITTGIGNNGFSSARDLLQFAASAPATIDMTAAQALRFTYTWGTASPSNEIRVRDALLEAV